MEKKELQQRFAAARGSGKRAKDAAESIGASEGLVLAAHVGLHQWPLKTVPLEPRWLEVLQALASCGPVLALTRNESTVHEKSGLYENVSASGPVGLALGDAIDLRLFFHQWHAGFAVTELAAQPDRQATLSLQFFDQSGLAVHKVFCRNGTDREAFLKVMGEFGDASSHPVFTKSLPARSIKEDAEVDAEGMLASWSAMTDTHEFFGLLKRFEVERQQSFRLALGRFTRRAPLSIARHLLQEAAVDSTPIMVFVGNVGCIQIHTGSVVRVEPMNISGTNWLNVLDAGFNLHLNEDAVGDAWVVEKPTADGTVTSIEVFDSKGELMAMFFGARKPGQPERDDWRALLSRLAPVSELVV